MARDASFVYSPLQEPYGMHARYVVKGDGVELIEVAGETKSERFEEYFRFVPRWRYLRYDREPPTALRALRPRDAPPRNPFYYLEASRKEEAQQTYRTLLARMAEAGAPVVLGSRAKTDVASGDAVPADNLSAVRIPRQRSFPYLAPRWHDGPLGNDLVARAFLLQILEGAEAQAPLLATRDLPWPDAPTREVAERPLADYESIEVALAGTPIAHFTSADPRRVHSLAEAGVVSLVAIKQPGESIIESCFLPVDFPLEDGMEATWSAEGGPPPPAPGRLRRLGGVNIGLLEIEGLRFRRQKRLLLDAPAPLPERVALELAGHAVLQGAKDGTELAMEPRGAPCRRLRATADGWVDPEVIGHAGVLDLVLRGGPGPALHIPFARWEWETVALPVARKGLAARLKIPAREARSGL